MDSIIATWILLHFVGNGDLNSDTWTAGLGCLHRPRRVGAARARLSDTGPGNRAQQQGAHRTACRATLSSPPSTVSWPYIVRRTALKSGEVCRSASVIRALDPGVRYCSASSKCASPCQSPFSRHHQYTLFFPSTSLPFSILSFPFRLRSLRLGRYWESRASGTIVRTCDSRRPKNVFDLFAMHHETTTSW